MSSTEEHPQRSACVRTCTICSNLASGVWLKIFLRAGNWTTVSLATRQKLDYQHANYIKQCFYYWFLLDKGNGLAAKLLLGIRTKFTTAMWAVGLKKPDLIFDIRYLLSRNTVIGAQRTVIKFSMIFLILRASFVGRLMYIVVLHTRDKHHLNLNNQK